MGSPVAVRSDQYSYPLRVGVIALEFQDVYRNVERSRL